MDARGESYGWLQRSLAFPVCSKLAVKHPKHFFKSSVAIPSKAASTYFNPYHCKYPISPAESHAPCIDHVLSPSVVSDSVWLYGLQSARLLCPWGSPGKNTGVGCHAQGIFPTQESNHVYLLWQAGSLPLVPPGEPMHSLRVSKFWCIQESPDKFKKFSTPGFHLETVWFNK